MRRRVRPVFPRSGVMRRPVSVPILGSPGRRVTVPLKISGQCVIAGASGAATGTIVLGPSGIGSSWHLTSAAWNTNPQNTADTPEVYLYSGGGPTPDNQLVHSYSGSADSADLNVELLVGESLRCVWINGDAAIGNVQLIGTATATQWG